MLNVLGILLAAILAMPPIASFAQQPQPQGMALPAMLRPQGRADFEKYGANTSEHKAFALCASGAWTIVTKQDSAQKAAEVALERIRKSVKDPDIPCRVHDVDGKVFEIGSTVFVSSEAALAALASVGLKKAFYAAEDKDAGIAAATSMNSNFHSPTPKTVPGAKSITTVQLKELMMSTTPPILVDVLPNPIRFLPGAVKNNDIGGDLTGAGDAAGQRFLEQQVKAKTDPVVFYCLSWECWLSYNAALRAVSWGYSNVYWYRGGYYAWFDAELPLEVGK